MPRESVRVSEVQAPCCSRRARTTQQCAREEHSSPNGRSSRQLGDTPQASCLLRPRAPRGMSPNCRPSRILDYLSREQVRATWRKAVICVPRQNVAQPVLCSFRARRGGVPVVLAASCRPPPRSYSLKSEFARNSACCTVFECQIPTRRISHPTTSQVRWGENIDP